MSDGGYCGECGTGLPSEPRAAFHWAGGFCHHDWVQGWGDRGWTQQPGTQCPIPYPTTPQSVALMMGLRK